MAVSVAIYHGQQRQVNFYYPSSSEILGPPHLVLRSEVEGAGRCAMSILDHGDHLWQWVCFVPFKAVTMSCCQLPFPLLPTASSSVACPFLRTNICPLCCEEHLALLLTALHCSLPVASQGIFPTQIRTPNPKPLTPKKSFVPVTNVHFLPALPMDGLDL